MSVEVYGGGGGASPKLQSKIVTPSTAQQIVTPDNGMDGLSKVTVNAMPGGTLAAPTISESGVITSKIEKGGYLNTGDNRTLRLSTQAGKTVVPTKFNQTVVSKGLFTTGDVNVSGDGNLIPENIKKGVSIFDVLGTFAGDGAYKAFFGTVHNDAVTANLTIPTPGETIAADKLRAVVIWSVYESTAPTSSELTLLWIYAPFTKALGAYIATANYSGIALLPPPIVISPQYGSILAGYSTMDRNCFGSMPYYYIVVADV